MTIGILGGLNVYVFAGLIRWFGLGLQFNDWKLLEDVDPFLPYATAAFHWSVPAAWAWAGAVVPMGFGIWTALHFAALATIRDWRVIAIALLTFPFWYDLASGNILTFCFVAAWHGLAGRRAGVVAFCILAALVPRPIMLPVLAYLLWTRTDARYAFAAAALVVGAAAFATGTAETWARLLLVASGNEYEKPWNVGPSRFLGVAWVPIGLVLGAILTWKGRLGLASLAISPYLIHYYAIMGLLELRPNEAVSKERAEQQGAWAARLTRTEYESP